MFPAESDKTVGTSIINYNWCIRHKTILIPFFGEKYILYMKRYDIANQEH